MNKKTSTQLLLESLVDESVARLQLLPNVAQLATMAEWADGLKEPCILWPKSAIGKPGWQYGQMSLPKQQGGKHPHIPAHKYAFICCFGEVPSGFNVCHRCDVTLCVNPFHLFCGTQKQNLQDASRKKRLSTPRGSGSANPFSIFIDDEVLEIRKMFASGMRLCQIQRKLGKGGKQTIRHIARGTTWKHLPVPERKEEKHVCCGAGWPPRCECGRLTKWIEVTKGPDGKPQDLPVDRKFRTALDEMGKELSFTKSP